MTSTEGQRPSAASKMALFDLEDDLKKTWATFTESSDEKCFRKFVRGLVSSWEKSNSWDDLMTSSLHGGCTIELGELPDELLPALSKFLIIAKDDADQGNVNSALVKKARDIINCVTITCRNVEFIPLVDSMHFVRTITQMSTLLLNHLLELESTFFMRKSKKKAEDATKNLRDEIIAFIIQSCHFLESLYDPYFQWRAYMFNGTSKKIDTTCPVALQQEVVPFLYESFETALVECFPDIGLEMLMVLGSVITGSRHNAIQSISPATSKMLLKTVRDSEATSQELHSCAIFISAKSIQVLHDIPIHERQVDINVIVQQYHQILNSLMERENVSLNILSQGVEVISKMLKVDHRPNELKTHLAQNGTIQILLDLLHDCKLQSQDKRNLIPIVIQRLSLILCDCPLANEKLEKSHGYDLLFNEVNNLGGPPDMSILKAILSMATHGQDLLIMEQEISSSSKSRLILKTVQPILYLLKWLSTTEYEHVNQQVWLCENLRSLCAANLQNKMMCCQNGLILKIVETLQKAHQRLDGKSAVELLLLLKSLGMHSINPLELKNVIALLKDPFPFKSHIIHVLSSMSKGHGFTVCRQYFDISNHNSDDTQNGITVPNIRQWSGPTAGFSFHCWIRLDQLDTMTMQRRQIYSFYTSNGNGFEAFVTSGGTLVIAVAYKKEFLAVPLENGPLDDELWHCLDICHSAAKRPFGSSTLQVFVDGAKRMECVLKYPTFSDPISYCTIGAPLIRGNVPALNLKDIKPTFKEGIMDAIKIGVPGVLNLSQLKSGSNDPHIRWTLIGLEDQLWGKSVPLSGQMGMICCFQDALSEQLVNLLYNMGPNNGLAFPSEDSPEALDIQNRLVFFYSARACLNNLCPNLHPPHLYEGHCHAKAFCTADVKDVINCIGGGVHVIFPLLESAFSDIEDKETISYMSAREEESFTQVKSKRNRRKTRSGSHDGVGQQQDSSSWEMVPSSSFSDWKLEQNPISGFLTLVKNFVTNHTINHEQLMRGGGIAIIGSLLIEAKEELIDVNVLMAVQLLVELATSTQDGKFLSQIHQSILFDFRIWSRSQFTVQIGHIQYLSTLIKSDRKYFRKKFGVQYFLDVIRAHYCTHENLSPVDCKTIRVALLGMIKYFLQREVTAKEAIPVITFMLASNHETVLLEITEMLLHYLESKVAKDQMFLVLYEAKRADLLYCLLLDKNFGLDTRLAILRLLSVMLQTPRVSSRYKLQRMHLAEGRYLGLLHLRMKRLEQPLSEAEAVALFDLMTIIEDSASFQGILGLVHQLRTSDVEVKLAISRKLMNILFAKSDAPTQFARQLGWQECLASLLIKTKLRPELETSVSVDDVISLDESVSIDSVGTLSPTHYIEKATNVAMSYLPSTNEVIDQVANRATVAKDVAQNIAADTVHRTRARASSFLETIRTRSNTITSREDGTDTASMTSSLISSRDQRSMTPQYLMNSSVDNFSFEPDQISQRSGSTSSDDLRSEATASTAKNDPSEDGVDMVDTIENENFEIRNIHDDKEEELCQLVINILFTIMWRGNRGTATSKSEASGKDRGCVIACINMLGLDNNNELYRSHIELKRKMVELCIQAVLADMKEPNANTTEVMTMAEDVMQWAYDLIVLDPYGNFNRKVSETLLDGILGLTETLMVFSEGKEDLEWGEMAKMAFDILLCCAEKAIQDMEICTMATAKLHALVQTRSASTCEENAFLMYRLSKIIHETIKNEEHYSFLVPIMKALLEKSKSTFQLTTQLPSLNLRLAGPQFFEHFKEYSGSEEWQYFISKKIQPIHQQYVSGYLAKLPTEMDEFWAECYEMSKVLTHKRSREIGESKLKFQSKYQEPYTALRKIENTRYNNVLGQLLSHSSFIKRRWLMAKRQFFGPRGAWSDENTAIWSEHWKLAYNENYERMRMKLIPNANFDPHIEASAQRDNVTVNKKDVMNLLNRLHLSKDAVRTEHLEDSLTEEDLKSIAMEKMETAQETNEDEKASEKLIMSEECERVTFMSVVKGKLEVTTSYVYFFDGSPYKQDEERHDFRWSLGEVRELHLRRYNLRRTALEAFLVDQTNMFLNFPTNRKRNKVYSRLVSLRLPNLLHSSSRSPAELLKSSGLTQKWINREISNFEYLMQLNTIAGRTFNDLSQYPVFPWVIIDYSSYKLDLNNPKTFRDLTKPIGIQNPKHVDEVKTKYENFEDPSGTVAKFHYGTHYSNSAMVLHYLVRIEPFTSLHIELQSGRFDVADRQFHSVQQTWKCLYDNVNDVKELVPEFFYFPEFLVNMNHFDFGKLQGGKKSQVNDVILPKWAANPDDFIRQHRMALESNYVSENLHHWIDLIFGFKQKGSPAEKALNVFYYCTYEGAVDLDAIDDPEEREAVEGMINNFGQTPCQLLKEPHPKRLSLDESLANTKGRKKRPSLMASMPDWKPYLLDLKASTDKDPVVFIHAPGFSKQKQYLAHTSSGGTTSDTIITISSSGLVGIHGWLLQDGLKEKANNDFAFDVDPTFVALAGNSNSSSSSHPKRVLPSTFAPGLNLTANMFVVTPDGKYIVSGGHWDNSLRIYSLQKGRNVASVVRHIDFVTCVTASGPYLMSGSLDTTSIVWDISASITAPRPLQVLAGHEKPIRAVALSVSLDLAVSGSEDGTVNVYTIKEGQFLRSLKPPLRSEGPASEKIEDFLVGKLSLSSQGHIVIGGHSRDVHSVHVYTINGRFLHSLEVLHRTTSLLVLDHEHILHGDENGELCIRDLYTGEVIHSLNLQMPIQNACLTARNTHLLVPLRDGKLIVVGSKIKK